MDLSIQIQNNLTQMDLDEISLLQQKIDGRKLNQLTMFDVLPIHIRV